MVKQGSPDVTDPQSMLADWANQRDEWARCVVRQILQTGRPAPEGDISTAYQLFLEEKGFAERSLPTEPSLAIEVGNSASEATLKLTSISEVTGVNALRSNPEIEIHDGLTILFGENGSGKTGYSRILKTLANSRTADDILSDINDSSAPAHPSATIKFEVGGKVDERHWAGERGVAPFTRMSIFDTPAVNIHVDDDITYVFTPASLSLFNHVTQGVRGVQKNLASGIEGLSGAPIPLTRFDRGTSVYPLIETLGAASDLADLKKLVDELGEDPANDEKNLQITVASLQSNTVGQKLKVQQRALRAFDECLKVVMALSSLSAEDYNSTLKTLSERRSDYAKFRETLFAAADLPEPPEEHWEEFIRAGSSYRAHLESGGHHDESRCLYCRQALSPDASELVVKYREYLEDKIADEIQKTEKHLAQLGSPILACSTSEAESLTKEDDGDEAPEYFETIRQVLTLSETLSEVLTKRSKIDSDDLKVVPGFKAKLDVYREAASANATELQKQVADGATALGEKSRELTELKARIELRKSWPELSTYVANQQKAHKLTALAKKFKPLLASLTELSTRASDQMVNGNFEQLFEEECTALRAPSLELAFVGRDATTKRKKVMTGNHKPSRVLSEGEQKVIALADFLAEARLTGISAPVVFDDPVSSLDHVRLSEVADRITELAATGQIIVFTHDILLATGLLARFEKSKRCMYYQVTSDHGPGAVTHASGPRWDSLSKLKAHVNDSIELAKKSEGETQSALIRTGYNWLRSWCEVFVETELLQGVSERYQPNVRMTALSKIKADVLPAAIEVIDKVFADACRYIDGHSQPLVTLDVPPTVSGLQEDWKQVTDARTAYLAS